MYAPPMPLTIRTNIEPGNYIIKATLNILIPNGQNGGDNRKYELLSNLLGVQVK
jgi:hypothetical protein